MNFKPVRFFYIYHSNKAELCECINAERAICYRPSVRPSVCPSHKWISQKRFEVKIMKLSPYSSPTLLFLRDIFRSEILIDSTRAGASNKGGVGKQ